MIAKASSRHSSASSIQKSDHEHTKTNDGVFHFLGLLNVAKDERITTLGSCPYRFLSRNI